MELNSGFQLLFPVSSFSFSPSHPQPPGLGSCSLSNRRSSHLISAPVADAPPRAVADPHTPSCSGSTFPLVWTSFPIPPTVGHSSETCSPPPTPQPPTPALFAIQIRTFSRQQLGRSSLASPRLLLGCECQRHVGKQL